MWLLRCAHIMSTQWAPLSFLTFVFEARPTLSIIEMLPLARLNKAPCSGVNCVGGTGEWKDVCRLLRSAQIHIKRGKNWLSCPYCCEPMNKPSKAQHSPYVCERTRPWTWTWSQTLKSKPDLAPGTSCFYLDVFTVVVWSRYAEDAMVSYIVSF